MAESSSVVDDVINEERVEPSTEELESFKNLVNDWFKYDDQIRKLQTAIKPDHENDCAKFKCGARSRITRRSACAPPWHLERDHHRIRNRPHARGERGERARESEQSQTPHQGQG